MRVVASWSGGKDCCLALHKAMLAGHDVADLLNFVSIGGKRCCFHGVDAALMRAQADSIGIPLTQHEVPEDMREYENEFKKAVSDLKRTRGIEAMVFGDIYLDEHREWVERVCAELGIEAIEPLWDSPVERVASEFIAAGFRAVVVACKSDILGEDFVGREFNCALVEELRNGGVCLCGENGEFHTLVTDGPIFRRRISIRESSPVLKDGFWKHWSLDIRKWEVIEK